MCYTSPEKRGGKGIIRLWSQNRKHGTNTGNNKPGCETTVRMTVVCILIWFFFSWSLHFFKVIFFFRYRTVVVRNSYIFDGDIDILGWMLRVVGMPNHWKTTSGGRERRKDCIPTVDPSYWPYKWDRLYLIAFKSWCAATGHQCKSLGSFHLPMGGKSASRTLYR